MKQLKDLHIGAKFADRNNPSVILRVAGHDLPGYPGTIGVTDNIIKQGCFDAKEPKNPDRARRDYGNNHYPTSNAHQWLNADGSDWYKPAHEHDAPPTADNIYDGDNPYAKDPGFLTAFSEEFTAALTEADIKTRNMKTGELETIKASVWLMSAREVGIEMKRPDDKDEGEQFPLFDDFRMKIASPSEEAVEAADWKPSNFNPTEGWYYFLRSPLAAYSHVVRIVLSDGSVTYSFAFYGTRGLRPALILKSDILVSDEPDENGIYIIG